MKKLFLILSFVFFANKSYAIEYTVSREHTLYIEHPSAGIDDEHFDGQDGAQGYTYAMQLDSLRNALTQPGEGNINRVTYDVGNQDISLVHVVRRDVNNNAMPPIDLVVRTRDLYMIGFINGAQNRRVLYRFDEPHGATLAWTLRPWTNRGAWHHLVRNLGLSYDYPTIERNARQSRYGSNMRISHRGLYHAFDELDQYDGHSLSQEFSRGILRILVGYFEAMRFQNIAERVAEAFSLRLTWIVDQDSAVLTNSWSTLSSFGSQTSLENDLERTLTPRSQHSSLSYPLINAFNAINNAVPLRNILSVALGSQWYPWRRASCSNLQRSYVNRHLLAWDSEYENSCGDNLLIKLGSRYFERDIGQGILSAVLN